MFIREKNGFTLIELLIVIGIIGIIIGVAVPKYVDLLEKANLAATIGNLSTIRSAINIYYASFFTYPDSIDPQVETKFAGSLNELPYVKSKYPFGDDSPYGNSVMISNNVSEVPSTRGKGWFYNKIDGKVYINSTATDIKGKIYYTH